jgi:hypothetical protein
LDIGAVRESQSRLLSMMRNENKEVAKAAALMWALNSDLGLADLTAAACLGQTCADALEQCQTALSKAR